MTTSLCSTQKFLYHLNRYVHVQQRCQDEQAGLLADYDLTDEEPKAIAGGDIGELYVLGCIGQLLMHFGRGSGSVKPCKYGFQGAIFGMLLPTCIVRDLVTWLPQRMK